MLVRISIVGFPWMLNVPTLPETTQVYYPTGVAQYIQSQKFVGNVVTSFETGAWISWKLSPEIKVSMDSRYEAAFPHHVFDDTMDFYKARDNWQDAFQRLAGDGVLIPRNFPICKIWEKTPLEGWKLAYEDDSSLFFVRKDAHLPYVNHRHQPLSNNVL